MTGTPNFSMQATYASTRGANDRAAGFYLQSRFKSGSRVFGVASGRPVEATCEKSC